VTDFLLDLQPGLAQVIAATSGGNTTRYVHSSRGVHAQEDNSGNWTYPLHDGLGSARGEVTDALAVQAQHHYAPYGERSGGSIAGGFDPMPFGFTGEQTDANDLLYLRARHYAPGLGVFTALDPVEGDMSDPMTLNRYAYVGGNPISNTDPSGMFIDYGVGGVSYANMTAFGQMRTRLLQARAVQQTQRLQRHINRAMHWLGWVNGINTCGLGLAGASSGKKQFRDQSKKSLGSHTISSKPLAQGDSCSNYPGWRLDYYSEDGMTIKEGCINDRTLYISDIIYGHYEVATPDELSIWWNKLTPTEKAIEEALADTNTPECQGNAPFGHIDAHTYDFVMNWITSNSSDIQRVSEDLRVDPALTAGILAAEMLFDYSPVDQYSDTTGLLGTGVSAAGGYGYSNAHLDTRQLAYEYIQPLIESGDVGPVNDLMAEGGVEGTRWVLGDFGAIMTTATIARWLVDPYTGNINSGYSTAQNLSPEDMGIIYTGYRAGVGGLSPGDNPAFRDDTHFRTRLSQEGLTCNGRLTLPLMRHMRSIFP
jgi:RHS repeat-associated protein